MAKKKKRENQSRIVDVGIALFIALAVGYGSISVLQTINGTNSMGYNLLDFKNKLSWILDKDMSYKVPILMLTLGMFVLLAQMTRKKSSGYKDAAGHGAYGDAVFSNADDLRESGLIAPEKESKWSEKNPLKTLGASEGIILGRIDDELIIIPPDSTLDNRNVFLVGSSGSAKGQAFVINNIINNTESSIIVTDPKGELFELTSEIKRDQGYKVLQVDFLNLKGNRYNPLAYIKTSLAATKLAQTISLNSAKDVKQDFFFNTAKDLLAGLIIYATQENNEANISGTIKGLFNEISNDELFLPNLCEDIGQSHPAYQYLKDAAASTGNTRTSILSSFAQQTGVFSLFEVAELTEKNDFSFHEIQEQKTILYVKIPIKDNPVPALTATFFDQLITTLYEIGDKNYSILPIPTIFLFDEFANIGKINDYDNTLSTCRGYGMSIITVIQDLAQLENKYGKELTRTIVNNHDTTLFLRTKDPETAKLFERLAGDTTIKFNTTSTSNGGGIFYLLGLGQANASKSTNEQLIKKPLISEAELLNMNPPDKCYVFMAGHKVEMQKAYQSIIYKGFVTGTKKVKVNGVNRFPYVYPQNREAYIKQFNLNPYKELEQQINKKNVVNESKIPDFSDQKVVTNTSKKEEAYETIVSNFFEQIEKKNKPKDEPIDVNVSTTKKNPVSGSTSGGRNINSSVDAVATINEVISSAEETAISDPETLSILKASAVIPERIRKADEQVDKIMNFENLFEELSLSEEASDSNKKSNEIDELPMF